MRLASLTAAVSLSLAPFVVADEAAPGFIIEDLPGTGVSATLSNGDYVIVGGAGIWHYRQDGTVIQILHSYSNYLFGTGIAVDPTETFVIASRDDGAWADTWRVDLAGGPATFLNYVSSSRIVFEDQDTVLMVTSGSGYRIDRLDLNTGNYTPKSTLYAASGPAMALDAAGNLYVAHGYQSSGISIERFSAAQVAGPGLLAPGGGGTVLYQGLEPVSSLQVTADGSTFYLAGGPAFTERIVELRGNSSRVLVAVSDRLYHLQLLPAPQPAQYLFGQPVFGGYLVYQARPGAGYMTRKALLPTPRAFLVK